MCFTEDRKSGWFGLTQGWINDDRIPRCYYIKYKLFIYWTLKVQFIQKWVFFYHLLYSPLCHSKPVTLFPLQNTEDDILKNAGDQTMAAPLDLTWFCVRTIEVNGDRRCYKHSSKYLLCVLQNKVRQVWNDKMTFWVNYPFKGHLKVL